MERKLTWMHSSVSSGKWDKTRTMLGRNFRQTKWTLCAECWTGIRPMPSNKGTRRWIGESERQAT